jgi:hypothetical protein
MRLLATKSREYRYVYVGNPLDLVSSRLERALNTHHLETVCDVTERRDATATRGREKKRHPLFSFCIGTFCMLYMKYCSEGLSLALRSRFAGAFQSTSLGLFCKK